MSTKSFLSLALCFLFLIHGVASINYLEALTKSLLYYEGQRSGKLPANQRVTWRGDSGLKDGSDAGVDLVGGYHDAGDNVKFGFPMAYTITMLSWSVVEFQGALTKNSELANALRAIKWGTDYLLKAHTEPNVLYGQVGDGDADHQCWERPEDMTTPRTSYKIDEDNPGSDLAGETSAALAAASIVFKSVDPKYATELITHSKQLYDFASNNLGKYQNSIPSAGEFYPSSDFQDELLWAAAWIHRATGEQVYLDVLSQAEDTGGFRTMFSWDDKFAGVQLLVAKLVLDGKVPGSGIWTDQYKGMVEEFICNCLQKGHNNFKMTPGGMLWWQLPSNDLQYTTTAIFLVTVYADYLAASNSAFLCRGGVIVQPAELITFAQSQVDHILGSNPRNMSYMVGFGTTYPTQVHHRGASIVSIKKDSTPVTCKGGYDAWYNRNATDPNVLTGAIVGGPDQSDSYTDARSNYNQAEPATASTAPLVGVLARLVV